MVWSLIQSYIISLVVVDLSIANIYIQSPMITDWGKWGPVEKCQNNTYVVGMQLKVESPMPPLRDDTALNGIRFFCSDLSGNQNSGEAMIQSTVGSWGTWRSPFYCVNGVVIGFQMRSEPPQGKHDDTGANNLRILCSDGSMIQGEGPAWGDWTAEQRCRKRQAICSIQTQVEEFQGGGDDTALNNLKVECCDVPNPAGNCTPSDFWELVAECDNTNAFTPTTCSYEKRVGLGYSAGQSDGTAGSQPNNHERSVLEGIGFSLGIEAQVLTKKFQLETGVGERTGYNWGRTFKTDTWKHESITKVTFDVPPRVTAQIVQVVGTCGLYLVRTSKFQRVDMVGVVGASGTTMMTSRSIIPTSTSPVLLPTNTSNLSTKLIG